MRCNVLQSRSLTTGLDHIPDYVLRYTFAPHLPRSTDRSKDPAPDNPRLYGPFIQRDFDPGWNRDGADMAALPNLIHDRPVPLAHLNLVQLKTD